MRTGAKKVSSSRNEWMVSGQSPRQNPANPRAHGAKYSWAAPSWPEIESSSWQAVIAPSKSPRSDRL
jgi:hypothetical protein